MQAHSWPIANCCSMGRESSSEAGAVPRAASLAKKHPTWILSRWGISASQLSALLVAAAKLEQHAPGGCLAVPPAAWEGTPEQKKVCFKKNAFLISLCHLTSSGMYGHQPLHTMHPAAARCCQC